MTRARMTMRMKMRTKRSERQIVRQSHALPVATGKCVKIIPAVQNKTQVPPA